MNTNFIRLFLITMISIALLTACGAAPKSKSAGKGKGSPIADDLGDEDGSSGDDRDDEQGKKDNTDDSDKLLDEELAGGGQQAGPGGENPKTPPNFTELNDSNDTFLGVINLGQLYGSSLKRSIYSHGKLIVDSTTEEEYDWESNVTFKRAGSEIRMIISFPASTKPYNNKASYTMSFSEDFVDKDKKPKLKQKEDKIYFKENNNAKQKPRALMDKWKFTSDGDLVGSIHYGLAGRIWDDDIIETFTIRIGDPSKNNEPFENLNDNSDSDILGGVKESTEKPENAPKEGASEAK